MRGVLTSGLPHMSLNAMEAQSPECAQEWKNGNKDPCCLRAFFCRATSNLGKMAAAAVFSLPRPCLSYLLWWGHQVLGSLGLGPLNEHHLIAKLDGSFLWLGRCLEGGCMDSREGLPPGKPTNDSSFESLCGQRCQFELVFRRTHAAMAWHALGSELRTSQSCMGIA